jgi:histone H3/H4
MEITNPSITRIARRSGVKSISEHCFPLIKQLITKETEDVIRKALIINSERQTKTLMPEDIYEALSLLGKNLTQSHDLGTGTITK